LDGSVGGKGSKDKFIQDTSLGGSLPPTSSPLSSESDDFVKPFEKKVNANTSGSHSQAPLEHKPAVLATASDEEEPFEVHSMLLFATRAATSTTGQSHPDYHKRSDADHFGLEVTEKCVPVVAQEMWQEAFRGAIDMMLQKNLHGMQHGLLQLAHSVVELIDGTTCGLLAHVGFEKLKDQAERLQVLASAGSLNDLDVTVQYEPLKGLTVGGVDIHRELNELIIAWQFKKGPEEMGRALAGFLRDFIDDSSETQEDGASHADIHETRTPKFWAEVLQTAMLRLGGGHDLMSESCLSAATAHTYGDALEDAIARMLEKTRHGMSSGIKEMAAATIAFVDGLENHCSAASGAIHLRSAADRLRIFASAKILAQPTHVEYEPMKVLKVGGIDVHRELNRFLAAWLHHQGAEELANGLVDFLQDFKEHEVEDSTDTSGSPAEEQEESNNGSESGEEAPQEPEVIGILRDAIHPESGVDREKVLSEDCLSEDMRTAFTDRVEKALDHMLQKRRRNMQLGLKELADVTSDTTKLFDESGCVHSRDVDVIQNGAKKLKTLTRKTIVDYGTHIKYEAMKGLVVGGVDIHRELNEFIGAWKLRSHREAGAPLGVLMRKLAEIEGHDEL
jgi:hypothetical protein